MGRQKLHRQRIRAQAASVEAKSLLAYLCAEVRARREVSTEEARLIAVDAQRFLERGLLALAPGQIEIPAIAGRTSHARRARTQQEERMIRLSVVADEDAALLEEFGVRGMQQGRLARWIEEAYAQDALLDGGRLCLLLPVTLRAVRDRLGALWEQGVLLPIAGMTKALREQMCAPRAVVALERYLQGDDLQRLRQELAVSRPRWQSWWWAFQESAARPGEDPAQVAQRLDVLPEWVAGWQAVWQEHKDTPTARERVGEPRPHPLPEPEEDEEARFRRRFLHEHGFTRAAVDVWTQEVRELAFRLNRTPRKTGQILTFGVAMDEPPGTSLAEARLLTVALDYVTTEDWGRVSRTRPKELKWARLERLCTQGYHQGVAFSLPDLSHLLGISVDAVQTAMKEHPQVVLPTRGWVADMGPTTSHAEKILSLFMDGYTETEIKQRSGHSYESIEKYVWDFARVVYLKEKGMPLPAIRQALAMSRRVVEKYLQLYERFKHPDYFFAMAKIRRRAEGGGLGKDPTPERR